jgi:hypothetical protein
MKEMGCLVGNLDLGPDDLQKLSLVLLLGRTTDKSSPFFIISQSCLLSF